jgi:hypothetical protein
MTELQKVYKFFHNLFLLGDRRLCIDDNIAPEKKQTDEWGSVQNPTAVNPK